jgi:micrococcal nuclease
MKRKRPFTRSSPRFPHWFGSPRLRRLFVRCAILAMLLAGIPLVLDDGPSPSTAAATYRPDATVQRDRAAPIHRRISVYDGDTIRLGRERIRIVGLDTPEYGDKARCREEARAAEQAKQALIGEIAHGGVELHRQGTDRYGRTLARVTVNGRAVADTLIAQGLARPYSGGYRAGWCG